MCGSSVFLEKMRCAHHCAHGNRLCEYISSCGWGLVCEVVRYKCFILATYIHRLSLWRRSWPRCAHRRNSRPVICLSSMRNGREDGTRRYVCDLHKSIRTILNIASGIYVVLC